MLKRKARINKVTDNKLCLYQFMFLKNGNIRVRKSNTYSEVESKTKTIITCDDGTLLFVEDKIGNLHINPELKVDDIFDFIIDDKKAFIYRYSISRITNNVIYLRYLYTNVDEKELQRERDEYKIFLKQAIDYYSEKAKVSENDQKEENND